jgi:hypothetical protein
MIGQKSYGAASQSLKVYYASSEAFECGGESLVVALKLFEFIALLMDNEVLLE